MGQSSIRAKKELRPETMRREALASDSRTVKGMFTVSQHLHRAEFNSLPDKVSVGQRFINSSDRETLTKSDCLAFLHARFRSTYKKPRDNAPPEKKGAKLVGFCNGLCRSSSAIHSRIESMIGVSLITLKRNNNSRSMSTRKVRTRIQFSSIFVHSQNFWNKKCLECNCNFLLCNTIRELRKHSIASIGIVSILEILCVVRTLWVENDPRNASV